MAKKSIKQIALAQHFLKNSKVEHLLQHASSITPFDTIFEIGAGGGAITVELARVAHKVIAIEKDPELVQGLRERFQRVDNVQIIERDFLRYRIADKEYKIVANIPYNITADIVRKVLYMPPVPSDAYLIVQKEAAEKIAGFPKETQFSILAKPLFTFRIVLELQRRDFRPASNVDSVLLHIHKRSPPLISGEDISLYRRFISFGFGRWKKNLKLAFKPIFTYKQWKHLSKDFHFPLDVTATELTFEQWLGLFDCLKHRVSIEKQACLKT